MVLKDLPFMTFYYLCTNVARALFLSRSRVAISYGGKLFIGETSANTDRSDDVVAFKPSG